MQPSCAGRADQPVLDFVLGWFENSGRLGRSRGVGLPSPSPSYDVRPIPPLWMIGQGRVIYVGTVSK
ncbi:hypothetical protein GOD53_32185, partial [Sinorhizobium medicae]|nr:hypothetical protein [Sinorhizobium medicae]MDX0698554.1 hypothetical protein [Sinorhizobium medicae]MDX0748252.1 hypothetical protein [Sinorhizobium medicae]